jgi:uncharacterized membrane protein
MPQSSKLDHVVAITLRASAYCAFVLAVAGLLSQLLHWSAAGLVLHAAIIFLLATPLLRIAVVAILFWQERDIKHALVALAVLVIIIGSSFLGAHVR